MAYTVNVYSQQCWCAFLLNFNISQQTDKKVKIHWETDGESPTAKDFIIQRSFNGSTYSDIGYLSANPGSSSKIYDFYDAYPCNGNTPSIVYYRIKSVNIDNNARFSVVKQLTLTGCPTNCSNQNLCRCNMNVLTGPSSICSGSAVYEVTNSSGPVTWSFSNTSIISYNVLTSTKVEVTKSGNGPLLINAAIPNCALKTISVTLGLPPQPTGILRNEIACVGGSEYEYQLIASPNVPSTSYIWTITSSNFGVSSSTTSNNEYWGYEGPADNSTVIGVQVKTQNGCGTSANQSFNYSFSPTICGGWYRMVLSPNPAKEDITIIVEDIRMNKINYKFKGIVQVYNENNILVRKIVTDREKIVLSRAGLKPGRYFVQITIGREKIAKQLVIE